MIHGRVMRMSSGVSQSGQFVVFPVRMLLCERLKELGSGILPS